MSFKKIKKIFSIRNNTGYFIMSIKFDLYNNKLLIICILQIATIYNAISQGWKVRKIGKKKYELSKHVSDFSNGELESFSLNCFVQNIIGL